jgi:hypothetical protein
MFSNHTYTHSRFPSRIQESSDALSFLNKYFFKFMKSIYLYEINHVLRLDFVPAHIIVTYGI